MIGLPVLSRFVPQCYARQVRFLVKALSPAARARGVLTPQKLAPWTVIRAQASNRHTILGQTPLTSVLVSGCKMSMSRTKRYIEVQMDNVVQVMFKMHRQKYMGHLSIFRLFMTLLAK